MQTNMPLVFSGYDLIWGNWDLSELYPDQSWVHQLDWPILYLNHLQSSDDGNKRNESSPIGLTLCIEGPDVRTCFKAALGSRKSFPCLGQKKIQSSDACLGLILNVMESSCQNRGGTQIHLVWFSWSDAKNVNSLEVVTVRLLINMDDKQGSIFLHWLIQLLQVNDDMDCITVRVSAFPK